MQRGGSDIGTGRLSAPIIDGDLRGLRFDGREVVRRVSYPVRDADWGTFPTVTLGEETGPGRYHRRFAEAGLWGIELDHPENREDWLPRLRELSAQYGLEVTGASDYHGAGKTNRMGERTSSAELVGRIRAEVVNPY